MAEININSINSFIEYAVLLYDIQKYNEALTLACVATAACANHKFSDIKEDGKNSVFFFDIILRTFAIRHCQE